MSKNEYENIEFDLFVEIKNLLERDSENDSEAINKIKVDALINHLSIYAFSSSDKEKLIYYVNKKIRENIVKLTALERKVDKSK